MTTILFDKLSGACVNCGDALTANARVRSAYFVKDLRKWQRQEQVEFGIVGREVRNFWTHVDCADPQLIKLTMTPSITHCIKCRVHLEREDVVAPVFSIDDAAAVNPEDPNDKGISIRERVYFVHVSCEDKSLTGSQGKIITL